MKQRNKRLPTKLRLSTETLRSLDSWELEHVAGGNTLYCSTATRKECSGCETCDGCTTTCPP